MLSFNSQNWKAIIGLGRVFHEFMVLSDAAFELASFVLALIKCHVEMSAWPPSFHCLGYCASNKRNIFAGFVNWPLISQP